MRWAVVAVVAVAWGGVALANGTHELTDQELQAEMMRNRALAQYVTRNGMPDVAEARFLSDVPPWDDHEVTLYYLGLRKQISFARAWILGRPTIQITRAERPLSEDDVRALSRRVHHYAEPTGTRSRAEAAADRADAAAARVEAAAESAERAADHAEAIAGKAEGSFHRAIRK